MIERSIKHLSILLFLFGFLFLFPFEGRSQEEPNRPFTLTQDGQSPYTINLDKEDSVVEQKKKKRKKNVFYGIKTRKAFTKTGTGDKTILEIFYCLKTPTETDPYVRDLYYFDLKDKKIKKTAKFDPKLGYLLHGPYKKMMGTQVVEEGIFFKGTRHGRWVTYNKNNILMNKEKYYKGWPKESLVKYYDQDRKKLKEVTPVEYGKKEGNYYLFYDNGLIAVSGEFKYDQKVGVWREYYKNKTKKKKEIQYRTDPFDDNFKPYILKEWDEKGNLIYERAATTASK